MQSSVSHKSLQVDTPVRQNTQRNVIPEVLLVTFYTLLQSAYWALTGYPAERYRRFLQQSQHWSREELENYRNEKLHKLVRHCYENVPYYRRAMKDNSLKPEDIRRAEDLCNFPVLTKDIVRTYAKDMLAANPSTMKVSWAKTGGTTGEPIRVCKDFNCQAWGNMCFERGLKWGGKSPFEPRAVLFGGSLGVDKQKILTRLGTKLRGNLFLPAFDLNSDNVSLYLEAIRRSGCRFLIGYSSALYRLANLALEKGQRLRLAAIFPTAELLLPAWEETAKVAFGCPVLPFYGCGEVASLGYTTLERNGYLIPEEHALLQVVKPDGTADLYGDGRFAITDLDNYAMPIIRYLNGDAGKIVSPSGPYPFRRIERLDGRYNSLLLTDTGELISGVIGTHIFRHTVSVKQYQIIQEEPLRVVIKIVPKGDLSDSDTQLIVRLFAKHLGSRMKITIEVVPDLPIPPSGKSVFVINRCLDSSQYSTTRGAIS